jgi:hypothetical protein
MGTAQREVAPDSLAYTDWVNTYTYIYNLRASIASGNTIYASDLNTIATLINNMNGHYHGYGDAYQLATYGAGYGQNPGAGDRTNYYERKSTNSIDASINTGTSTAANTDITAARHNELRNAINELRSHYHGINDRTA